MTDEKKKPEDDEVTEEQLKDVSGGLIDIPAVPLADMLQPDTSNIGQQQAQMLSNLMKVEGSTADPIIDNAK